jgi:3-phosphoglycerate kinase
VLSIQPPQPEIVQVSDKIQLMENILDKADVLRVG